MKICQTCKRFISDLKSRCIYCKSESHKPIELKNSSISKNYLIYSHEILVDDQAFRIDGTLGKGGFGTVLKVFDPGVKKFYAMKVPLIFDEIFTNNKANREDDIIQSSKYIENEVNTIMKYMDDTFLYIHKKGTASAFSKGINNDFPVYLMELAEGTLKDLFKAKYIKTLAYEEKEKIIKETVNAISHLHNLDVLHRDLSPDNIFVVDRGGRINYVLGDFGAAKGLFQAQNLSKSSKIVGHSAYLDPLRFDDKYRYDFRIDLYSLGIIVTELLLGDLWTNIVGEENIAHLMAFDFEKDFLLKDGAKRITPEILKVLQKAVSRKIENRLDKVSEFRTQLFRAMEIDSKKVTSVTEIDLSNPAEDFADKKISFDISFTVDLPFPKSDKTFTQTIINYKNEKLLVLKHYQGAKVEFSDFTPKSGKVIGTDLYGLTFMNKSVILNFKNSEFLKHQRAAGNIAERIRGKMIFDCRVELKGA